MSVYESSSMLYILRLPVIDNDKVGTPLLIVIVIIPCTFAIAVLLKCRVNDREHN